MDLKSHPFRCFAVLAEEASFTRAAERVGLTQSALSMRMRAMEQQLGLSLFHRSSRSVALTREGEELLGQAQRVVEETDRFNALAAELTSDAAEASLAIAMPINPLGYPVWMDVINRFAANEPAVPLRTTRRGSTDILATVEAGHADIGFIAGMPLTGVPVISLARYGVRLVLPKESLLARRNRLSTDDLAGLRVAAFDRSINPWFFAQALAPLEPLGVELETPPEGIIGAGFAVRARLATIALHSPEGDRMLSGARDAFDADSADMVVREVEGLSLGVDFCAIKAPGASRRAVRRFWEVAVRCAQRGALAAGAVA